MAVAEELASSPRMTVITNSLLIAQTLSKGNSDHKVFVVGGEYSLDSAETSGPLVVAQLKEFNVGGALITVGSINEKGIMDFESRHAEIARTMIQQANFVTVVADGSKFTKSAVFKICDLDEIDRIVVNIKPEGAIEKALTAARIEIISPFSL